VHRFFQRDWWAAVERFETHITSQKKILSQVQNLDLTLAIFKGKSSNLSFRSFRFFERPA